MWYQRVIAVVVPVAVEVEVTVDIEVASVSCPVAGLDVQDTWKCWADLESELVEHSKLEHGPESTVYRYRMTIWIGDLFSS